MNHFMKTVSLLMVMLICVLSGCKNQSGSNGTFEIGDKTFLLNGKPFIIKAAEIHYTRIPVEYWEHRIQMCKALGMNTICIYAFWNIHEQKPGEFDFSGQNDIAAFCRLAQKNGMYIMLRPGPYVCSEWEMGGLPWWLLKKEDIQLRTNDPYFIERTLIYMNEIGKQLADRHRKLVRHNRPLQPMAFRFQKALQKRSPDIFQPGRHLPAFLYLEIQAFHHRGKIRLRTLLPCVQAQFLGQPLQACSIPLRNIIRRPDQIQQLLLF